MKLKKRYAKERIKANYKIAKDGNPCNKVSTVIFKLHSINQYKPIQPVKGY